MKQIGLYDVPDQDNTPNIKGFSALSIYADQITSELWFTQSPTCVDVKSANSVTRVGSGALSIEWNKQAGDCPWLGMGVGWDNWTGKDFSQIVSDAALSFWVKTKGGSYKGLPWAVGFEDFSGGQAWTGLTSNLVEGGVITENWTQMIVPLENFPFLGFDVDLTAIKQVIFQFESSGKVFVDDIRIVPFKAKGRQSMSVKQVNNLIQANTFMQVNGSGFPATIGNSKVNIGFDGMNLYISADIVDDSPAINNQMNENIWNGDALELAFSTLPGVDPKRKIFYNTDHHLGIKMGEQPMVYDWTSGKALNNCDVQIVRKDSGYSTEVVIPWYSFNAGSWDAGNAYDLEIAIDMGNSNGIRTEQLRWNSQGSEGFNTNPSLWGQIFIIP